MPDTIHAAPSAINSFLVKNGILVKDNPAISPDMTLDFESLCGSVRKDSAELADRIGRARFGGLNTVLDKTILWHRSKFTVKGERFYLVESIAAGDCGLVTAGTQDLPFDQVREMGKSLRIVPLYWDNLVALKNFVLEDDPDSTIFPVAADSLAHTSLGIGARFTTLHWPGVAWAMRHLGLSLTANQNSIPRELVYDVNAMLDGRLSDLPFPFIGGSVPEGHQGQSVQGMSHAAIITYLKYGFHKNRIPWGFNADHQPIGGRFDDIEKELVAGSLFASYITFDLSPELAGRFILEDREAISKQLKENIDTEFYNSVLHELDQTGVQPDSHEVASLVVFLMPAMEKMKRRDSLYRSAREYSFSAGKGRKFHRELSIDELPGQTTPHTLAVALAMARALGVEFQFIAPNVGFQKNFAYDDNDGLRKKIAALYDVASRFGVSIGFHSGSGKSEENYRACGELTRGNFEIKTAGRYTYEMGVALSQSPDRRDRQLWKEWYDFTRELAVEGAFSGNETRRNLAREFVTQALEREDIPLQGAFDTPGSLGAALGMLPPSPEHMFWFEYNFLYVLAAKGDTRRLGDHSAEGYMQRKRFYSISDKARVLFAKRVAGYVVHLAYCTGLVDRKTVETIRSRLESLQDSQTFLKDILAEESQLQ
ncbi:MAG: hypothetical protein GF418_07865 [Chitinivibrionales bacterium]|nr:hypothetical protein [Chitinivibrionales bacterium]MBD3395528.1 hypothetical protein [Chitinivibrionales bacterium]